MRGLIPWCMIVSLLPAACGGLPPLREAAYPIDCRPGLSAQELLKRGDAHRDVMLSGTPPANTVPEQWTPIRKIHAARARTCYQLVLDAKQDHAYALMNSGFTHLVESTYPESTPEARDLALVSATNFLQKAFDAEPLDAQSYYYLGEIAARRGQCDKALRIFQALVTSGWSYSHVYAWTGYCQELAGRSNDAKTSYQKAVTLSNPIGIAEWARSRVAP
ncbi:MAG: tetratricopeptide repeat protein [Nitrospirota bacterium]